MPIESSGQMNVHRSAAVTVCRSMVSTVVLPTTRRLSWKVISPTLPPNHSLIAMTLKVFGV